jgi:transcriptional regulator with XRE-family HTH domain
MLGRRVAAKRAEKRLSQTALGELADLSQNTISALERGERTSVALNVVIAVAEALGVGLDYLVFGEKGPPWTRAESTGL